jgi:hypothetical protein
VLDLKLNAFKFALSAAIIAAIAMFLLPVSAIYFGKGIRTLSYLGGIFPGYDATWIGAGLGFVYGLVGTLIVGWIEILLYNCLVDYKGMEVKTKAKRPAKRKRR